MTTLQACTELAAVDSALRAARTTGRGGVVGLLANRRAFLVMVIRKGGLS